MEKAAALLYLSDRELSDTAATSARDAQKGTWLKRGYIWRMSRKGPFPIPSSWWM